MSGLMVCSLVQYFIDLDYKNIDLDYKNILELKVCTTIFWMKSITFSVHNISGIITYDDNVTKKSEIANKLW